MERDEYVTADQEEVIDLSDHGIRSRMVGDTRIRGRIIAFQELETFKQMTIGEKLRFIREELEKMYPKDFTWRKVSSSANVSYQGLRDIENGDSTPRQDTIRILADHYEMPFEWFVEGEHTMNGFYLGKEEDRTAFFNLYKAENMFSHPLDSRKPKYNIEKVNPWVDEELEVDDLGFPIILNQDETEYTVKNSFKLTIDLMAYDNVNNDEMRHRMISEPAVLTLHDIEHIESLIIHEIRYLTEKNKKARESYGFVANKEWLIDPDNNL